MSTQQQGDIVILGIMDKDASGATVVTNRWLFFCPACKCGHAITTKMQDGSPGWTFNNDQRRPTITPSIAVSWDDDKGRHFCHSYVTEGRIQFLPDCTHALKGKTVPLAPFNVSAPNKN